MAGTRLSAAPMVLARENKLLAELIKNAGGVSAKSERRARSWRRVRAPYRRRSRRQFRPKARRSGIARVARCRLSNPTMDHVEGCMTRAYVQLGLLPLDHQASRTLQLARYGRYGVRRLEFPNAPANTPLFWLELYDCDAEAGLDACSGHDLEEGTSKAEQFSAEAKRLSDVGVSRVTPFPLRHRGR